VGRNNIGAKKPVNYIEKNRIKANAGSPGKKTTDKAMVSQISSVSDSQS
jgi:hypothetical protein